MGKNIFDDLPLTLSRREPQPARRESRPERAEPQLFPASGVRPIDPLVADAQVASPVGTGGHVPVLSPTPFAPDRLAAGSPGCRRARWCFSPLSGLVAIGVIGASYGIGFSLLSGPARQTVTASGPNSAPLPPPISPDAGHKARHRDSRSYPRSTGRAAAGGGRRNRSAADQSRPNCPAAAPEQRITAASRPGAKAASTPAAPPVATRDAAPPSPSPQKAAAHHAAGHPPARPPQPEHQRTASRDAAFADPTAMARRPRRGRLVSPGP